MGRLPSKSTINNIFKSGELVLHIFRHPAKRNQLKTFKECRVTSFDFFVRFVLWYRVETLHYCCSKRSHSAVNLADLPQASFMSKIYLREENQWFCKGHLSTEFLADLSKKRRQKIRNLALCTESSGESPTSKKGSRNCREIYDENISIQMLVLERTCQWNALLRHTCERSRTSAKVLYRAVRQRKSLESSSSAPIRSSQCKHSTLAVIAQAFL